MDTLRFFLMTSSQRLRAVSVAVNFPRLVLPSVSSLLPEVSPAFPDNHPRFTTTLVSLQSPKAATFQLRNNYGLTPQWHCEGVPLSGSLQLRVEYQASLCKSDIGPGMAFYNPNPLDPESSLQSWGVWSLSWQCCLFCPRLPGFGALSQMPDDLHWPANWATKPRCFPKAFRESREKGKNDCKVWHPILRSWRVYLLQNYIPRSAE